jgi:hypothetical protein
VCGGDDQKMHIAGWRSIGLIVSAAWIVGTLIGLAITDIRIAKLLRYSAFEVCDYVNYHLCYCGNCWRNLMKAAEFVDYPVVNFVLISLTPVVLAWLGVSLTLKVWQWVRSW